MTNSINCENIVVSTSSFSTGSLVASDLELKSKKFLKVLEHLLLSNAWLVVLLYGFSLLSEILNLVIQFSRLFVKNKPNIRKTESSSNFQNVLYFSVELLDITLVSRR